MYKILLIGPQGSGKGTQAQLLSKRLGIPALAMGQLLRDEVAQKSPVGLQVKSVLDKGELVSDVLAAEVLKVRLQKEDALQGYMLDGYPRNMDQYRAFTFDVPTHVIVLELPREESLKRLSGRLTCNRCGQVYSRFAGHTKDEQCICGGILEIRSDDTTEAISRRLDIYEKETSTMIKSYEEKGLVHRVDGLGTIKEIEQRLLGVLKI